MTKKYLTTSPSQTKKLGEILAKEILKTKIKKTAFTIGLEGDLGGGKTTFLQGFAKGLGIKQKILSPTFIIMRKFRIPKVISHKSLVNSQWFFHIDCYRIQKTKELLDLGFKKIISDPRNLVAVEWSDRVRKILPRGTLNLKFQFVGPHKRKILIKIKK
jgi:tRNA threonylcarbamoyladenosine biosynthesis protein TsaE